MAKPCRGCGGSKDGAPAGASYCPTCRDDRAKPKGCSRCGAPKLPGQGNRLCENCEPLRYRPGVYRPCLKCGERAPKVKGGHYCHDCAEMVREIAPARARAKQLAARKSCVDCGKPKGAKRRLYCDNCAVERGKPKPCNACGVRPIRAPGKNYCQECHEYATKRRNAYRARWRREQWAKDPEKYRAYHRRLKRKHKHKNRARDAENKRIAYRLQREAEGVGLAEVRSLRALRGKDYTTCLPARPLAAAIDAYAERHRLDLGAVCALAGIDERQRWSWAAGEIQDVQNKIASRVLTGLGLLWFEVWPDLEDVAA